MRKLFHFPIWFEDSVLCCVAACGWYCKTRATGCWVYVQRNIHITITVSSHRTCRSCTRVPCMRRSKRNKKQKMNAFASGYVTFTSISFKPSVSTASSHMAHTLIYTTDPLSSSANVEEGRRAAIVFAQLQNGTHTIKLKFPMGPALNVFTPSRNAWTNRARGSSCVFRHFAIHKVRCFIFIIYCCSSTINGYKNCSRCRYERAKWVSIYGWFIEASETMPEDRVLLV